jgi:hypothetical protein
MSATVSGSSGTSKCTAPAPLRDARRTEARAYAGWSGWRGMPWAGWSAEGAAFATSSTSTSPAGSAGRVALRWALRRARACRWGKAAAVVECTPTLSPDARGEGRLRPGVVPTAAGERASSSPRRARRDSLRSGRAARRWAWRPELAFERVESAAGAPLAARRSGFLCPAGFPLATVPSQLPRISFGGSNHPRRPPPARCYAARCLALSASILVAVVQIGETRRGCSRLSFAEHVRANLLAVSCPFLDEVEFVRTEPHLRIRHHPRKPRNVL